MRLTSFIGAALGAALLAAACSQSVTDVCNCPSCSHPFGACPGEVIDAGASDATGER